ncbi:MAG: sulfotransferase [Pseudomonadota bacterium]
MSQPKPKAIVVFGALRSGTTLLRLMLDQHPRLAAPGETDYMFDHITGGAASAPVYDEAALANDRIYRFYRNKFGLDPNIPQTMNDMLRTKAGPKAPHDPLVVVLLHRNLGRALTYLPGVRVLHLVRDPRDVARSSIGMGWAGSTYYGVEHWLKTEQEWRAHAAQMTDEQILQVKYEQLIEDPGKTLGQICDFFGVAFDPAMLDYDSDSTYSKPDPKLVYQWRHKQTPREIGLVEARVGTLLPALGYELSGHPPVVPGPLARARLALQQRTFTWSTRFKRFGVRDPLLAMLARRLGRPELGRAAQRRIDKAKEQFVK